MPLDFNVNFKIDKRIWEKFIEKYPRKASERLREFILNDLKLEHDVVTVNRDDLEGLRRLIFNNDKPIQLTGKVGVGKTTSIKRLIESDDEHIYIVFDCHDEYDLPEIQTLTTNLTQSSRIKMPKQISASQGLFPVYFNQILSRKYPENYVIVIEEAHRYEETRVLLKEARKFVKLIAILQEPIGDFCPIIKVVE